ncbi:hypothetical protein GCM10027299_42550 [Larkinella ripae]
MKRWTILFLFVSLTALAQTDGQFKKGNTVYIESTTKNESSQETVNAFAENLKEQGYWQVASDKQAADFVIKLSVEASKGITATSWGGTSVACSAQVCDKSGSVLWESDTYKASPNGTNGFNAKKAAARKLAKAIEKKYQS